MLLTFTFALQNSISVSEQTGQKISFAALTEIVYQSGDIVIGWSYRDSDGNVQYNMNLKKTDCKTFVRGDQLVIISQGE